jgi:hypothetical protein
MAARVQLKKSLAVSLKELNSAASYSRWFLDRRFFYPEDGGDTFFRNVGSHKIYTEPHPRRRNFSIII